MVSLKQKAQSSARNDCLAPQRIDYLDYEQIVQTFHKKQRLIKQLQEQLDDISQKVAACVAVLQCSNAGQLSEVLDQQHQEGVTARPASVPLDTCRAVEQCLHAEHRVSLHKLLGTEIIQVSDDKLMCMTHTQNVREDSLPLQLFTITKAPGSEFFRMRPREITYHLSMDVALRNLMVRSSYDDIIHCFRNVQSLIFDLVDRDNVYQALKKEQSIQHSLSCSKDRKQISFTLPMKATAPIGKEEGLSHDGWQNIKSLMSMISVCLHFDAAARRGWGAQICCPRDPELKEIPGHVDRALRTFLASLPKEGVVTCVSEMLLELSRRQSSLLDSSDSEQSGSPSDEFAGIF